MAPSPARLIQREAAGLAEAILQSAVLIVNSAQARRFVVERAIVVDKMSVCGLRQVGSDSAGKNVIEKVSFTESVKIGAKQVLLQSGKLGQPKRKTRIVAQCAKIAEMIGETLVLQRKGAKAQATQRDRCLRDGFERGAVGPGERNGGVAGDARRETMTVILRHRLEEFRDAFVRIAEAFFQPKDLFANDGKTEMSRLDDSCMDRPNRDLVYPVAFDFNKRIGGGWPLFVGLRWVRVATQRIDSRWPAVMQEPWALVRGSAGNAKQVACCAFQAGGSGKDSSQCWVGGPGDIRDIVAQHERTFGEKKCGMNGKVTIAGTIVAHPTASGTLRRSPSIHPRSSATPLRSNLHGCMQCSTEAD